MAEGPLTGHCWALMHCDCSKQLTHGLGSSLPTPILHQTQSRPAHVRIPLNLTLYVRGSHPWQAEVLRVVSNYIYIMHCCLLLCYKPHYCPGQCSNWCTKAILPCSLRRLKDSAWQPYLRHTFLCSRFHEHWREVLVEHHLPVSCGKIVKGSVEGC